MSAERYDAWWQRHALLFGLNTDEDAQRYLEWTRFFEESAFTPEELTRATDWMVLHGDAPYRTEHLAALRKIVLQMRSGESSRPTDRPDLGTCTLCGNSGMVDVPSVKALASGLWGTQAVYCRCPLGSWIKFRQGGRLHNGETRQPLLTIDEYERERPNWKRLMQLHDDEVATALQAKFGRGPCARDMDETLNRLLERSRKAMG